MQKVLTAAEMREVDRLTTEKYGIPLILLMENAAHAAARVITERLGGSIEGKSVLILCGKGNNGGDGAALARVLWTLGANVDVFLFGKVDETKGDARVNFEIVKRISDGNPFASDTGFFYLTEIESYKTYLEENKNLAKDVLIDAIFGTGLSRKIEGDLSNVIPHISHWMPRGTKSFIVSLDLPSGMNADTAYPYLIFENKGESQFYLESAARPDLTITFTAPKLANVFPPASNFNGELVVANIGSPQELVDAAPSQIYVAEKSDARDWLVKTRVRTDSYKKTRGTALVVAGSASYAGAAVLAANACFAAGAGMVSVGVPASVRATIAAKIADEIIVRSFKETASGAFDESAAAGVLEAAAKMNVVALGCGLTSGDESTGKFVRTVVENRRTPTVIDADGLNALAPFDLRGSDDLPVVLTPHIGEFQRLLGTTDEVTDRIETARQFAQKHNVILLVKGERSIVAAPGGTVVINPTGNAGIARAGSGDTLTGIIAGFLAQTFGTEKPNLQNTFETVVAALYVSGLAGDIAAEKFGQRLMSATDVRECLGDAIEALNG